MTGHPLISIIVPIYNAEKYLRKCIDSILTQTNQDFELILVNDGSKDCSGAICDEYKQKDSRISVFHQPNSGVSSARNLGIQQALGEYLCFIDSDDCITPDYLQSFGSLNDKHDIYVQGITLVRENSERPILLTPASLDCIETMSAYVGNCLPFTPQGYPFRLPFCKLIRHELFKEIRFDPTISLYEDYIANVQLYQKAKTMTVVAGTGYNYLQDNSILSRKRYPVEQFLNWNRQIHEQIRSLSNIWNAEQLFVETLNIRLYYLCLRHVLLPCYSMSDRLRILGFIHSTLRDNKVEGKYIPHSELRIIKALHPSWLTFFVLKVRSRLKL